MTGPLSGLRVIEYGDEKVEFAGRLLSGGGADIIKIEPPGGSPTRAYGPFLQDSGDPNESLHFWHYNLGKQSVVADLDTEDGVRVFRQLVETADVLLDGSGLDYLANRGLSYESLSDANPRLVMCGVTDFGRGGPWQDYQAGDLVHLALGGQMMVCGYNPVGDFDPEDPSSHYDTPPIAPQMWHAYHTVGVNAAIAIYGALFWREISGAGQFIDISVHLALAAMTELSVPHWIYNHKPVFRQTGMHAYPSIGLQWQLQASDGKYVNVHSPLYGTGSMWPKFVGLLARVGLAGDLGEARFNDVSYRGQPAQATRLMEVTKTYLSLHGAEEACQLAQAAGLPWAVIRWPEDNVDDQHFRTRGVVRDVDHPEHGRSFAYPIVPWLSDQMPWHVGPRAPLIGEHTGTGKSVRH